LETSSSPSANGGNWDWTASSTATPAPGISGSIDLFQPFDGFKETGSFFEEVQTGYNYMVPNRLSLVPRLMRRF